MPTEVIVWVFPGILFIVTVLVGVIFRFNREEFKELKDSNEEQNKRFQDLESRIYKLDNDVLNEAKQMIREVKESAEKDRALDRADTREQMSQMRDSLHRMESNIINQMKMLITAHKE